jgi:CHRD domain
MMRMTTQVLGGLLLGSAGLLLGQGNFKADLSGYNEVLAISTTGAGQITVQISGDQKSLDVTLSFTNLEGVASAANLYLGTPATTGGVVANLCGSPKPACPVTANGTVTVTLGLADVLAVPTQGVVAANMAALVNAIENGAVYVNVITSKFANGEIRGQLSRGGGPPPGRGNGNHGSRGGPER